MKKLREYKIVPRNIKLCNTELYLTNNVNIPFIKIKYISYFCSSSVQPFVGRLRGDCNFCRSIKIWESGPAETSFLSHYVLQSCSLQSQSRLPLELLKPTISTGHYLQTSDKLSARYDIGHVCGLWSSSLVRHDVHPLLGRCCLVEVNLLDYVYNCVVLMTPNYSEKVL